MQDIEIVLENLASQEVTPDQAQQLFLETFIFVSFSVNSISVSLNSSKYSLNSFISFLSIFI